MFEIKYLKGVVLYSQTLVRARTFAKQNDFQMLS